MRYRPKYREQPKPSTAIVDKPPVADRYVVQDARWLGYTLAALIVVGLVWFFSETIFIPRPAHYTVTIIASQAFAGTPPKMNGLGQVAYTALPRTGGANPVAWLDDGRLNKPLPLPPGFVAAYALAINNNASVVGYAVDRHYNKQTVLWRNGAFQLLGPEVGQTYSINDYEEIITGDAQGHLAYWRKGKWSHVDFYPAGQNRPLVIDNYDNIYGIASPTNSSTEEHEYEWQNGAARDLGAISEEMTGAGMNDKGQIAGTCGRPETACVYDHGSVTDLNALGGSKSEGHAINDRGLLVGASFNGPFALSLTQLGLSHGFLLYKGHTHDLNDLIPSSATCTVLSGDDINDRGQILCTARFGLYSSRQAVVRLDQAP